MDSEELKDKYGGGDGREMGHAAAAAGAGALALSSYSALACLGRWRGSWSRWAFPMHSHFTPGCLDVHSYPSQ